MSIKDINYRRELWVRMTTTNEYMPVVNEIRVSRFVFSQMVRTYKEMRTAGMTADRSRSLVCSIAWAAAMEGMVFKGENYTDDMLIWFKPSQNPAHLETVKARP